MYLKVVFNGHAGALSDGLALIIIAFGYLLNKACVADRRHRAADSIDGLILQAHTIDIVGFFDTI